MLPLPASPRLTSFFLSSVPERKGAEETFSRLALGHLAGQEVCAALEVVWPDAGFESEEWQQKIEDREEVWLCH